MDITIPLGVWIVPILGLIAAYIYHVKNYEPGGYFPDYGTQLVSLIIFLASLIFAAAYYIGKWLG